MYSPQVGFDDNNSRSNLIWVGYDNAELESDLLQIGYDFFKSATTMLG